MNYLYLFLFCVYSFLAITHTQAHDELNLMFVNLLWRHGARSPIMALPKDPHGPDTWPQGFGQLTQVGMHQQYNLGLFLKQRYNNLLSAMYNRLQIYIRSTDVDRTLMSAECNLAGMFPPVGRQKWNGTHSHWQPVPVHTVPVAEDKLLRYPPTNSSEYDKIINKVWNLPHLQKLERENKKFLEEIRKFTSYPKELTVKNVYEVRDVFVCEKFQNLSWPDWLTDERYDRMLNLSGVEMGTLFGVNTEYVKTIAQLGAGALLKQILQNMDDRIKGSSSYNVIAYSAHDTTLAALLVAVQAYDMLPPPFASCIMLELYNRTSTDGTVSYVVRAFYRTSATKKPKQLSLLGCSLDCSLDELKRRAEALYPPQTGSDTWTEKYLFAYATLVSITLLLMWLVLAIQSIRSRQKSNEWRKRYHKVELSEDEKDDRFLMS